MRSGKYTLFNFQFPFPRHWKRVYIAVQNMDTNVECNKWKQLTIFLHHYKDQKSHLDLDTSGPSSLWWLVYASLFLFFITHNHNKDSEHFGCWSCLLITSWRMRAPHIVFRSYILEIILKLKINTPWTQSMILTFCFLLWEVESRILPNFFSSYILKASCSSLGLVNLCSDFYIIEI